MECQLSHWMNQFIVETSSGIFCAQVRLNKFHNVAKMHNSIVLVIMKGENDKVIYSNEL